MLSNNDDLALREFKLGCKSLLDELKSYHSNKKRQIELCFLKLLDNVPSEIINAPINECIESYLDVIKSKDFESLNDKNEENNKNFVVDNSICDSTVTTGAKSNLTHLDDENDIILGKNAHQGFNNLTSTVKKINAGKLQSLKQKIDEQSIIHEVEPDLTPTKEKNTYKQQKENIKPLKNDQIGVRVLYFLKDLTQVSIRLSDLNSVELKQVHENCIKDLNIISNAILNR